MSKESIGQAVLEPKLQAPDIPRPIGNTLIALTCICSIAKGQVPVVHLDELYFWLNSYAHGYVRRGLVGTFLGPLTINSSSDTLRLGLFGLHIILLPCVVLAVFLIAARGTGPLWSADRLIMLCLLLASPFLGQLAHHVGYPDELICLVLCGAAAWLNTASGPGLAGLLVASCCFHELCFLLLLPMVIFGLALRRDTRRSHITWTVMATISAALLTLAAQPPDTVLAHSLIEAGLSPDTAKLQIAESLDRSLTDWFLIMLALWRHNALNAVMGLTYAGIPTVLILILGARRAREAIMKRTSSHAGRFALGALYIASCISGCLVLAIALDLSRIVSFTTLTAFLTATHLPRQASQSLPDKRLIGVATCAAIVYAGMPVCDLHFAYGRVVNLARVGILCEPCAAGGRAFLNFYDRGLAPDLVRYIQTDPMLGNHSE